MNGDDMPAKLNSAPVGSSIQATTDGVMTWTRTVTETDQRAFVVQCPRCKAFYYLLNPPLGSLAVTIDHQSGDNCTAFIGGVHANKL